MAITAEKKSCTQGWTLVAQGAASAVCLFPLGATGGKLLPTNSSSAPGAHSASTPSLPLDTLKESNLVSDSSTYWWVHNPSTVAFDIIVWKL